MSSVPEPADRSAGATERVAFGSGVMSVELAGTSSWRLEGKSSQLCDLALFVRDAAALETADDVPALLGAVPDLSDVLDADARRTAGAQWQGWWTEIIDFEFRERAGDRRDVRLLAHQRVSGLEAVLDRPEFRSLADRRELQTAVRTAFPRFMTWWTARSAQGRDGRPGSLLDCALVKQTAEDVAFDRQVSPDAVQAKVAVLPVQGTWWHRVMPGVVLYSPAAASDRATAQHLLRDAFDSFVRR